MNIKENKKRLVSMLLCFAILLNMLPSFSVLSENTTVNEKDKADTSAVLAAENEVKYYDPHVDTSTGKQNNPTVETVSDVTVVESSTTTVTWNTGWYVVGGSDVTISGRITVSGTVNLILADGASLEAKAGITVNTGNTLTIWGQEEGSGKLVATGNSSYAGIGSTSSYAAGNIYIYGGTVTAAGGSSGNGAAGIGGGSGRGITAIIISGNATVEATGGSSSYGGAGIGSGGGTSASNIKISGDSNVTAVGGNGTSSSVYGGAGIGAGGYYSASNITITDNAVVNATGSTGGAGIGGGGGDSGSNINISGRAQVVATGGTTDGSVGGAGIGGGRGYYGSVTISDNARVTAKSTSGASGIGGGSGNGLTSSSSRVTINGGIVEASGESGPAFGASKSNINISCIHTTYGNTENESTFEIIEDAKGNQTVDDWSIYRWVKVQCAFYVVFDAVGGTPVPETQIFPMLGRVIEPDPEPARINRIFAGWYRSPTYEESTKWNFATIVTESVTLYAKWDRVPGTEVDGSYYDPDVDPETGKQGPNGSAKTADDADGLTADMITLVDGWYVVTESIDFTDRIVISGDVNLILRDGTHLNAAAGISVNSGNSLTIWPQTEEGTGVLTASSQGGAAAIGGDSGTSSGTIRIYGGTVTATNSATSSGGAGIGGGYNYGYGQNITISGNAKVTATGGYYAAGIGGGYRGYGRYITISGSAVVEATGGYNAAGIGGGCYDAQGTDITITDNAVVTAIGGGSGAGIGGGSKGYSNTYATVTISGNAKVRAEGGTGIGGGVDSNHVSNKITITGGEVEVSGTSDRAFGAPDASINISFTHITYGNTDNAASDEIVEATGDAFNGWSGLKWIKIRYGFAVRFDTLGGAPVPQAQIFFEEGQFAVSPIPEPERDGYVFKGWYTSDRFDKEWKFEDTPVTESVTLYAKWTRPEDYDVNDEYYDPDVENDGANPEIKHAPNPTELDDFMTTWNEGWYVVTNSLVFTKRIEINGHVNLILGEGTHLDLRAGIHVDNSADNTLTIWAQSAAGTGMLTATGQGGNAGIGGNKSAGTSSNGADASANGIYIYGGHVTAIGSSTGTGTSNRGGSAGIGGGYYGKGENIVISGIADVIAEGGTGYGSSSSAGTHGGAGIGGGTNSQGNNITISGSAAVAATGGDGRTGGAGIGGAYNTANNITIKGNAVVTATGAASAAGIGGGNYSGSNITITDHARVTATGNGGGAGIGGGYNSAGTNIVISGDAEVSASATQGTYSSTNSVYGGAGIGGGGTYSTSSSNYGSVTISGNAKVTAKGTGGGSGIGGGSYNNFSTSNSISILDNAVVTASSDTGRAIGAPDSNVTVSERHTAYVSAENESADNILKLPGSTALEDDGTWEDYRWAYIVPGYAAVYNAMGGSPTPGAEVFEEAGHTLIRPDDPTRLTYEFQGWYTDPEFSGEAWDFDADTLETSVILYAKWYRAEDYKPAGNYWDPDVDLNTGKQGTPQYKQAPSDKVIELTVKGVLTEKNDGRYIIPELSGDNWYVVTEDLVFNDRIYVNGNVNIILNEGTHLQALAGISVSAGSTLTIWSESEAGTGKLTATAKSGSKDAGIGGEYAFNRFSYDGQSYHGVDGLYIFGGKIFAQGDGGGAGIGGSYCGSSSGSGAGKHIYISGNADVTAIGGVDGSYGGAGIGGGGTGSSGNPTAGSYIYISGNAKVSATGAGGGAGIGGGSRGSGSYIFILDHASVTAAGGDYSSGGGTGIGGGYSASGSYITITDDAKVAATGGDSTSTSSGAAGIGGSGSSGSYITIGGNAEVEAHAGSTASGAYGGAGIGGGHGNSGSNIVIKDNANVESDAANGGGAGIGGGAGYSGSVTISDNATVTATSGGSGAGIGGGNGSYGNVTISGDTTVTAASSGNGSGIGGGAGSYGTVTISDNATVTATSGGSGAGIGGSGSYCTVTISGSPNVKAGSEGGYGIGGITSSSYYSAKVTINGGVIEAYTSGENTYAIGDNDPAINFEHATFGNTENMETTDIVEMSGVEFDAWDTLKWVKIQSAYVVKFDLRGGTSATATDPQIIFGAGQHIVKPEDPVRNRYEFKGWYDNADYNGSPWDFDSDTVTSSMTLYAKWEKLPQYAGKAEYYDPEVDYDGRQGRDETDPDSIKTAENVTDLTGNMTYWSSGWYVVEDPLLEIGSRITVSGNVNLILSDEAHLNAMYGIYITPGSTLTIWGQKEGTGRLTATGYGGYAGIGGGSTEYSSIYAGINIFGGTINAVGSVYNSYYGSAGIGGGGYSRGGYILISGNANVTAIGGNASYGGAGIGSGGNGYGCDHITISGDAKVNATGSGGSTYGPSGIGGGGRDDGKYISILDNAEVTATGSRGGAGIGAGSGPYSSAQNILISDNAKVTAIGGTGGGAGIGSGSGNYYAREIEISGNAHVTAIGGGGGAGIGGGNGNYATITIRGNINIVAQSTGTGSGIGPGSGGSVENSSITVSDLTGVIEASSEDSYAIGVTPVIISSHATYGNAENDPCEDIIEATGREMDDWSGYKWVRIFPAYVLVFDPMGGEPAPDVQLFFEPGCLGTEPPAMTRPGRVFLGWYTDPEYAEDSKWNFTENTVDATLTLYAKWERENPLAEVWYYDPDLNIETGDPGDGAGSKKIEAPNFTEVLINTTVWSDGWYYFDDMLEFRERITVSGNVNLILADGAVLNATAGIHVPEGSSLSIWGQEGGTGKLIATGRTVYQSNLSVITGAYAAIGSNSYENAGTIKIYGGDIEARGGTLILQPYSYSIGGAGIGSGALGHARSGIYIYGGKVTATGGGDINTYTCSSGAGIGSGFNGDADGIYIYAGEVTAIGGQTTDAYGSYVSGGAGIGSGGFGSGGYGSDERSSAVNIVIGGKAVVTAYGAEGTYYNGGDFYTYQGGAGIGGGYQSDAYRITIQGSAKVIATGSGAGIGSGNCGSAGDIVIKDNAYVEATAKNYGAGIGGGDRGSAKNITITGKTTVIAVGSSGAGIGSGGRGTAENITIGTENGDEAWPDITAVGTSGGAGIGGGYGIRTYLGHNVYLNEYGEAIGITIYTGTITARGSYGAGIGGGEYAYAEDINIYGGTITATGSSDAAGIGGGYYYGSGRNINIYGGHIVANGSGGGAGIGGGYNGTGEDITIYGGYVEAESTGEGAGIGGGGYAGAERITIYSGTVIATGGYYRYGGGAGIGGGHNGSAEDITIHDGTVIATGNEGGAGIGGGHYGSYAKNITIHGGRIFASGGSYNGQSGNGIGVGVYAYEGCSGVVITGGDIEARSEYNSGIGCTPDLTQYTGHITLANMFYRSPTNPIVEPREDWSDLSWVHILPGRIAIFFSRGGTPVAVQTVDDDGYLTEPEEPIYNGHSFMGWYTDRDYAGEAWDFAKDTAEGSITRLYAKWEPGPDFADWWTGEVDYWDPAISNDASGNRVIGIAGHKTAYDVRMVQPYELTWGEEGMTTWYAVWDDMEVDEYFTVKGDVNLILMGYCSFSAFAGINVPEGQSLTIWMEAYYDYYNDEYYPTYNRMFATGIDHAAGIGGLNGEGSGRITINGGEIYAYGSDNAAGIGGGRSGDGHDITVNSGEIHAGGGAGSADCSAGAGIGGGGNAKGHDIIINSGTVYAYGGAAYSGNTYGGAGIGGGGGDGYNIFINGEYQEYDYYVSFDTSVYAFGEGNGAGIGGGGKGGNGHDITVSGWAQAYSERGANIGGGGVAYDGQENAANGYNITIKGDRTYIVAGDIPMADEPGDSEEERPAHLYGAGIGGGYPGKDSSNRATSGKAYNITVSGEDMMVFASGGTDGGAGIGAGSADREAYNIVIQGGSSEASDSLSGSAVVATSYKDIAIGGAGRDIAGSDYSITISGAQVMAEGLLGGIGWSTGFANMIKIENSIVMAAATDGTAIGIGSGTLGGIVIDKSFIPSAIGSGSGAGIGAAIGGTAANIRITDSTVGEPDGFDLSGVPEDYIQGAVGGSDGGVGIGDIDRTTDILILDSAVTAKGGRRRITAISGTVTFTEGDRTYQHVTKGNLAENTPRDKIVEWTGNLSDDWSGWYWAQIRFGYVLSFDSRGGMDPAPQAVPYPGGGYGSRPQDPTKTGYDFVGWYTEPDGGILWSFYYDAVTEDTVLYAHWEENGRTDCGGCENGTCHCSKDCACEGCSHMHCGEDDDWNIVFKDGDTVISSIFILEGHELDREDIPDGSELTPRDGMILSGWVDEDGNQLGLTPPHGDTTYTALWTPEEDVTVFHRLESTDELRLGAHYIILPKDSSPYLRQALSASNPVYGAIEKLPQPEKDKLVIKNTDIKGDFVLNLTKFTEAVQSNANHGSFTYDAFRLSTSGGMKLKMGISRENMEPIFDSKNAGDIILMLNDDGSGTWAINNTTRCLHFNSGYAEYYYLEYHATYESHPELFFYYDFEIWTDATSTEELGEREYVEYNPLGWDPTSLSAEEMVIVYTDPISGRSYALSVNNPGSAIDVTDKLQEYEINTGEQTTLLTVDRVNAWTVGSGWDLSSAWPGDPRAQLEQKNMRLWLSGDSLFWADSRENPDAEPSKTINAYFSIDYKFDENGTVIIEAIMVHGTEDNRYLGWDPETKSFVGKKSKDEAIKLRIFGPEQLSEFHTYYRLTDLSKLQFEDKFVITLPDPAHWNPDEDGYKPDEYLIRSSYSPSGWLATFGRTFVQDDPGSGGKITVKSTSLVEFVHGDLLEGSKGTNGTTWWAFDSIHVDGGLYWYPQKMDTVDADGNSYAPFGPDLKNVRFQYAGGTFADGSRSIYIRGNGSSTWLGVVDGKFAIVDDISKAVPVRIYALSQNDPINVIYFDENNNWLGTVATQEYFTLRRMNDVERESDEAVAKNGKFTYTFLGWTTDSTLAGYLGLHDSADLYDYDDATRKGGYKGYVKDAYKLVGSGNPDAPDNVNLNDYSDYFVDVDGQKTLMLYPIYIVRGIDTVVTADEDDTPVIGISDWKALQYDPNQYRDEAKEKWLGSVNIEVYKDGALWVDSVPMYFSYHNDDAVDLNIKFIWDSIIANEYAANSDKYKDLYAHLGYSYLTEDPLYWYMSDVERFPQYDQIGHFILDAVYAVQGGSEDGLKYSLNWMTDHGGQLDNVKGGSTVKVYVTTKYDVLYYLDDQLITAPAWVDDGLYTTKGTEEKFKKDTEDVEYPVREGFLDALMDRDLTTGYYPDIENDDGYDNPDTFITDSIKRGEYNTFSYFIREYDHVIDIKDMPTQELIDAMSGEGRWLISKSWALKDVNKDIKEHVAWNAEYPVTGTVYGTGNTAFTYMEAKHEGEYEADAPYTYHLYAYTTAFMLPGSGGIGTVPIYMISITLMLVGGCLLFRKRRDTDS